MSGLQKNVASQKWIVFAFDRTDNTPKAGDAANITANLRIDGAAADAVDDANPTELEDGYYYFDLTQAETNGDMILICPASSTGDIQVIGVPGVIFTVAPNANTVSIANNAAAANVTRWLSQACAAVTVNGVPEVDLTHINGVAQRATDLAEIAQYLFANAAVLNNILADDCVIAQMLAVDGDVSDYNDNNHSLEALRARGDAAWITATSVTVSDKTGFSLAANQSGVTVGTVNAATLADGAHGGASAVLTLNRLVISANNAAGAVDIDNSGGPGIDARGSTQGLYVAGVTQDIQGNITGSISGSVASVTGHTAQTGDNFARLGAPVGASIAADIAALPTAAEVWTGAGNVIDGSTPQEAMRYIAAGVCGKVSGAGTGTETFVGIDGATNRMRSTVDGSGNRSAVAYDP